MRNDKNNFMKNDFYKTESSIEYQKVKVVKNLFKILQGKEEFETCPDYISCKEALEDIDMLEYLLETAYSGKNYFENKGINFEHVYTKLKKYIKQNNDKISVKEFEELIVSLLNNINDGHFKIIGHKRHSFKKRKDAYFADVLLEENDQKNYVVISSKDDNVQRDSIFTEKIKDKYLFRTLSPKGEKYFLLGILSYKEKNKLKLSFNNKNVEISLHPCKMKEVMHDKTANNKLKKRFKKIKGIPILEEVTFMGDEELLEKHKNWGKKLKKSEKFIFHISNNGGGSGIYPLALFEEINGFVEKAGIEGYLYSPAILQAYQEIEFPSNIPEDQKRFINQQIDKMEKLKLQKAPSIHWKINNYNSIFYKLKIIYKKILNFTLKRAQKCKFPVIIANRYTGSAGENAISMSQSLKNSIFIGENSSGSSGFGEVIYYYLPNSLIVLQLASQMSLWPGYEEGVGFLPDYWLDSSSPVKEVIKWLDNPQTIKI